MEDAARSVVQRAIRRSWVKLIGIYVTVVLRRPIVRMLESVSVFVWRASVKKYVWSFIGLGEHS
jgi:hypothetical protein